MRFSLSTIVLGLVACVEVSDGKEESVTDNSEQEIIDEDGDGIGADEGDCDDSNPLAYPGSVQEAVNGECMLDMDGDGFGERDPPENIDPGTDCNDSDFALHSKLEDADCDGAKTADDCDDSTTNLGPKTDDQDCDGVIAIEDCDDNNAVCSLFYLSGSKKEYQSIPNIYSSKMNKL